MPTSITSTIVSFLRDHHDYSVEFCGAFLGAFFAFIFFIINEKIKSYIDLRKKIKKGHAYLERYLGDLRQLIEYNNGLLPIIIKGYGKKEASLMDFITLPIKDGLTMEIKDLLFINKLEVYSMEIKRLNLSLNNTNNWRSRINNDLTNSSNKANSRGNAMLINFLNEIKVYNNIFAYHIYKINQLIAENRILLKKNNNWRHFNNKIKRELKTRTELIEKEVEWSNDPKNNPMMEDYSDGLKKFGLL